MKKQKKQKKKRKKMIINELFTGENGLFEKIFAPMFPVLYKSIFGEDDPKLIDIDLRFKYGNRTLVDAVTTENATDIVKSIITVKFEEWQKQIQVFNNEYDVLNPVTSKETVTTSSTVDETGNNNTVDSSVTFNDGDFGNDTKQQRDSTGNRQETGTKTSSKSGIPTSVPVSEIIQKEMSLRKTNFKTQVITELVKELTIDIY
ncbi:MAG: hypothetical protein [Bacteriophage sp.]|nr:MAG: hypothetical protein [Bacteriophage sp.]